MSPSLLYPLLCLLGLSLATSCTRTPAPDTTPTLRLWKAAHEETRQDWEKLLDPFQQSHPGLTLKILSHPWEGWDERYATAFTGGIPPDVAYMPDEFWPRFAAAGHLMPLDQRFPEAVAQMQREYPDNLWQLGTLNGHQYGIPYVYVPWHLLYNRALFDQAGLPYPPATPDAPDFDQWTWERFFNTARALTRDLDGDSRPDQWGFAWTGLDPNPNAIYPFLWQGGADLLDASRQRSGLRQRGVVGLAFIQRLARSGVLPEGGLHPAPDELFYGGRAGMLMTSAASTAVLARDFPDLPVGAAIVPQGPATDFYEGRGAFGNAGFWVIPEHTRHPEAAFALLRFITDQQQVETMMQHLRLFGARLDWSPPQDEALMDTFIEGRRFLVPYPLHRRLRLVHSIIQAEVQFLLLGDKTPVQATADAADAVDALLSLR